MLRVNHHPARGMFMRDEIKLLWDAAAKWYKLPKRHYHVIAHADDVATALVIPMGETSSSLLLAARWHDAVYVPGAGVGVNEDASAAAMLHEARLLGISDIAAVTEAAALIRQTSIAHHRARFKLHGEIAALLDADLHSMGVDYLTFVRNQRAIYREQTGGHLATRSQLSASARWLTEFAARRPYMFHTDIARRSWEQAAQNNITMFNAEYGN